MILFPIPVVAGDARGGRGHGWPGRDNPSETIVLAAGTATLYCTHMASKHQSSVKDASLGRVAAGLGIYPAEAYDFVQQGLSYTVHRVHADAAAAAGGAVQHVSGQQLCHGLREYALAQWGLLARAVLRRWNITTTLDFGQIVFAMIEAGQFQKTEDDRLDDFRDVFDFRTAFESSGYRIGLHAVCG